MAGVTTDHFLRRSDRRGRTYHAIEKIIWYTSLALFALIVLLAIGKACPGYDNVSETLLGFLNWLHG
ncbi:MAG TPA: hypothetical protein VFE46_02975 [Pirellulales bacterium]|nr:hypothetical protein [Pirellulales bacterium]